MDLCASVDLCDQITWLGKSLTHEHIHIKLHFIIKAWDVNVHNRNQVKNMSNIVKKQSKKAGLPPGSLVHVSDVVQEKIKISLMDFNAEHLIERTDISIEECLKFMNNSSTITWINIRGIHDPTIIESLGKHFQFHSLILEDVMNASQRSKLDDYKDYIFIVVRMLYYSDKKGVQDEQVSIVLGKDYVISFLEDSIDIFGSVRARIRNENKRIRTLGADYLCYALIDSIVDQYFVILEAVDKEMEVLEESLIAKPESTIMRKIQHLKREIILLRKSVWPMREVINHFRRIDSTLVSEDTQVYMNDVYDHTIQAIDTIESFRDVASGLLEVYLSGISQHMNEIMKVLTIVSTIFVPLTFIASIYGMNFDYMPELRWKWGYPFVLLTMLSVACVMLYNFYRKKWI